MKFSEFNLKPSLQEGIKKIGFYETTEVQDKIIPMLLKHQNVIGKSETGTGKTHAFLIPLLQGIDEEKFEVQAVIISPTRELALQIHHEIVRLMKDIDARLYVGGSDREAELNRLRIHQPQIVIGTIGKLIDLAVSSNELKIHTAKFLVIDEADMVFESKEIEYIDQLFVKFEQNIQVALFSATISKPLIHFVNKYLTKCEMVDLTSKEMTKSTIKQIFIPTKNQDKLALLVDLLHSFTPYLVLIFANTKIMVDEIASYLGNHQIKCAVLSGNLSSNERKQVLKRIKEGAYHYVVCSDIASRGVDIEGVSHVINFELPEDIEFFIHRVGRTARYQQDGYAISFYDYDNEDYVHQLIKKGLKCSFQVLKNGVLVPTRTRNRMVKPMEALKAEEELHRKTPMPKKVKPGYRKKRNEQIKKELQKMKRKKINDLYHKKGKMKND